MKMMQKSLLALAVLATTAMNVQANSNVDVKVIGSIDPGTCTPTLSGGGTVDYGTMSPSILKATGYTQLDIKKLDFEINCTAPSKVAVVAVNGRPNTVAGSNGDYSGSGISMLNIGYPSLAGYSTIYAAGLGLSGTSKIGGYELAIDKSTVKLDTKDVASLARFSANGTWLAETDSVSLLYSGPTQAQVSWASTGTTTPLAFSTMTGKLAVRAYLNQRSELDLTNTIKLDGLSTLELIYLP